MELDGQRDLYAEFVAQSPELAVKVQSAVDKGRAHLEHGHPDEAKREFQRALALYPHVPAALNNLALLAYGEGDRQRARTYLEQLLEFAPNEPTANALMARHWLDEGALPLANRFSDVALKSLTVLSQQAGSVDPSRLRRATEFTCQALAGLDDDSSLVRLYTEIEGTQLLPPTLVQVGIAFYNRGHFDAAIQVWQKALNASGDMSPAQTYLEMLEVIQQHQLLPFRLDHRLDMPEPDQNHQVLLVHVPTILLATGLVRLYKGTAEEAEDALPLLASVGLPGFRLILTQVANDVTRPHRLRMLAAIQVVASGDYSTGAGVANQIQRSELANEDEALWCLLGAMLAEAADNHTEAYRLACEGEQLFASVGDPEDTHPFRQILNELAERIRPSEAKTTDGSHDSANVQTLHVKSGAGTQRMPDAEWLRIALGRSIPASLEESLAMRSREDIAELARHLGEQAPEKVSSDTLVRRTAMRLRSLPLDRIKAWLSPASRQMLHWIAAQPVTPLLSDLYARFPEESIWSMIEELYRSGLVNIGRKEGAAAPIQPTDVCLDLPVGLRARFIQAE